MKWIKTVFLALAIVAVTATMSYAKEKIITDNDGNKWVIDTATAATPGAGSGEGALVGAVSDTVPAYESHKWDMQFGMTAMSTTAEDSTNAETAVTGLTMFYRPSLAWRIGFSMAWDTVDRSAVTFGLPIGYKLFASPWSSVNWWVGLNVLPTYTVRLEDAGVGLHESPWSWKPGTEFKVEVPMGQWSAEVGLGASVPFSVEGITEESENDAIKKLAGSAIFAINWRLR